MKLNHTIGRHIVIKVLFLVVMAYKCFYLVFLSVSVIFLILFIILNLSGTRFEKYSIGITIQMQYFDGAIEQQSCRHPSLNKCTTASSCLLCWQIWPNWLSNKKCIYLFYTACFFFFFTKFYFLFWFQLTKRFSNTYFLFWVKCSVINLDGNHWL